jgi:hypothetical protein
MNSSYFSKLESCLGSAFSPSIVMVVDLERKPYLLIFKGVKPRLNAHRFIIH